MRCWFALFGIALLAVEDITGRALALDGEFQVEIGLRPGVSMGDVKLANAAWGTRPEMARLERVAFHLKLIPLLFRQIEVSHVDLIGLDLLLETGEDGIHDWDFRRERAAMATPGEVVDPEAEVVPAEVVAATEAETGVALTALIRNVRIEDATVRYHDARSGETHEFVVDDLVASMRSESSPFLFRIAARYENEPIDLEGELAGPVAPSRAGRSASTSRSRPADSPST